MRLVLALLTLIAATAAQAQPDTLHTTSSIDSVRVYFQGARVMRTAKVQLPTGESVVAIGGLPVQLDADHLEVGTTGNAEIISVNHRVHTPKDADLRRQSEVWEKKRKDIEYNLKALANEIEVFDIEERLLLENINLGGKEQGTSATQLREAANLYRTRLNEVRKAKLDLSVRMEELRDDLRASNAGYNRVKSRLNTRESEVLVRIKADAGGAARLALSYYSDAAGWEPTYDFRVNEITDPLEMTYKARVYQTTGEDWNNTHFAFTSGYPALSGTAPELNKWYINRPQPRPQQRVPRGRGALVGQVRDAATGEFLPFVNLSMKVGDDTRYATVSDAEGRYAFKPVDAGRYTLGAAYVGYNTFNVSVNVTANQTSAYDVNMMPDETVLEMVTMRADAAPMAKRSRSQMSGVQMEDEAYAAEPPVPAMQLTANQTTFRPNGKLTVRSDGRDTPIELKTEKVAAEYVYRAVPKYDDAVYLVARLPNMDRGDLLSGVSNIYYQGTYAGEAYVDAQSTEDTLELSLGRDRHITVKRERDKELDDKRIFSDKVKETVGWKLTVRNNKAVPVHLELLDQYPLSELKTIEIDRGGADGGEVEADTGKITWTLELPANTSQTRTFSYTLKYPKGVRVYGR